MTPERPPGTAPVGPDRPGEADQSPRPFAPARPHLGPEDWRATQEIAAGLGETERGPLGQVGRVVGQLGADRARAFLTRTQEIEAAGGPAAPRRQPSPHPRRHLLPSRACRRHPHPRGSRLHFPAPVRAQRAHEGGGRHLATDHAPTTRARAVVGLGG